MPPRNPVASQRSDNPLKNLPRPQKIAVIILFISALAVVFFWASQFRSQLTRPLGIDKKNSAEKKTADTGSADKKDTDNDGLTDADEVNIYQTSPFLEDSDSDGLTDKEEIDKGTDPNCPEGKNCNAPIQTVTETTTPIDQFGDQTTTPLDVSQGQSTSTLEQALKGEIDATSLRALLISSGADKATLDQISDEDLMSSYQETLKNQNQTNQ